MTQGPAWSPERTYVLRAGPGRRALPEINKLEFTQQEPSHGAEAAAIARVAANCGMQRAVLFLPQSEDWQVLGRLAPNQPCIVRPNVRVWRRRGCA